MKKTNRKYKHIRRMISVLLVLAVMLSLAVPFNVFAEEEEPAKPGEMHAIVYVINPDKKKTDGTINPEDNLEIVFQKGGEEDPNRTLWEHYENFGGAEMANSNPPWRSDKCNKSNGVSNIVKVDIKDRIQSVSMCM